MRLYYDATDLQEFLGISKASAYKIIRQLNEELKSSNYIVLQGKVPIKYFEKRWYGGLDSSN